MCADTYRNARDSFTLAAATAAAAAAAAAAVLGKEDGTFRFTCIYISASLPCSLIWLARADLVFVNFQSPCRSRRPIT